MATKRSHTCYCQECHAERVHTVRRSLSESGIDDVPEVSRDGLSWERTYQIVQCTCGRISFVLQTYFEG